MQTLIYNQKTGRTKVLYRGVQVVWYLLGALEVLLVFRFVLKLMAANPLAGFSRFVYSLSQPFVAPFMAVFKSTAQGGNVLEWTTVLAMLVYLILASGLVKLFSISRPVSPTEAAVKLNEEE